MSSVKQIVEEVCSSLPTNMVVDHVDHVGEDKATIHVDAPNEDKKFIITIYEVIVFQDK